MWPQIYVLLDETVQLLIDCSALTTHFSFLSLHYSLTHTASSSSFLIFNYSFFFSYFWLFAAHSPLLILPISMHTNHCSFLTHSSSFNIRYLFFIVPFSLLTTLLLILCSALLTPHFSLFTLHFFFLATQNLTFPYDFC